MVEAQEPADIGDSGRAYIIDLVFYQGDDAIGVADTKYKVPSETATDDISQVIAYAEAKQVERAFLVYPEELDNPIDTTVEDFNVNTLTFGQGEGPGGEGDQFTAEFNRTFPSSYELTPA